MAIINTISTPSQFRDSFIAVDRDNFSGPAYEVLYEYLEMLSDDLEKDMVLDPVAICCDWGEYTLNDLRQEFEEDEEESDEDLLERLHDTGVLLRVEQYSGEDTFLYTA